VRRYTWGHHRAGEEQAADPARGPEHPVPVRRALLRRRRVVVGWCGLNPVLKAPDFQRLKLQYEELLSSVAFNGILRPYVVGRPHAGLWTALVGRCRLNWLDTRVESAKLQRLKPKCDNVFTSSPSWKPCFSA